MGQLSLHNKSSSVDEIYDNHNTYITTCIYTSDIKSRDGTSIEEMLVDIHNEEHKLSGKIIEHDEKLMDHQVRITTNEEHLMIQGKTIEENIDEIKNIHYNYAEFYNEYQKNKKDVLSSHIVFAVLLLIYLITIIFLIVQVNILNAKVNNPNHYITIERDITNGMSERTIEDHPIENK